MLKFDVRHTLAETRRDLKRYQRKALPKAARQALNRTVVSARAAAVEVMAKRIGLKQKDARASTSITKAHGGRLIAAINARSRPTNVIRSMTTAQIRSWVNSRKRIRTLRAKPWLKKREWRQRVFIGNQDRTVFIRTGQGRKAIRGLYGPSVAPELIRKTVRAAVRRRIRLRFPIELNAALNNELRKSGFK